MGECGRAQTVRAPTRSLRRASMLKLGRAGSEAKPAMPRMRRPTTPTVPPSPHDRLFKICFEVPRHAASLFIAALPPCVASSIDWTTLTLQSGEYSNPQTPSLFSDLLYTATLHGKVLYLLIEHQSHPHPHMPLRMLAYMVRIWRVQTGRGIPFFLGRSLLAADCSPGFASSLQPANTRHCSTAEKVESETNTCNGAKAKADYPSSAFFPSRPPLQNLFQVTVPCPLPLHRHPASLGHHLHRLDLSLPRIWRTLRHRVPHALLGHPLHCGLLW